MPDELKIWVNLYPNLFNSYHRQGQASKPLCNYYLPLFLRGRRVLVHEGNAQVGMWFRADPTELFGGHRSTTPGLHARFECRLAAAYPDPSAFSYGEKEQPVKLSMLAVAMPRPTPVNGGFGFPARPSRI